MLAGSGKSVIWFVFFYSLLAFYCSLFFASSSIIQDIMAECETGYAIMAYFYFDFKDLKKQTCRDLLLSLVSQLSTCSSSCCNVLHRVYEAHDKRSEERRVGRPNEMLAARGQRGCQPQGGWSRKCKVQVGEV